MKPLTKQCATLLRTPMRRLTAWLDTDYSTAARLVADIRRRCSEFLQGHLPPEEVHWIFPYVRDCRRASRCRLAVQDLIPVDSLPDATCGEPAGHLSESDEPDRLLQLMDQSVRQFATADQHSRYAAYRQSGCKASQGQCRSQAVSRATLHESVEKARQLGLAGLMLLAARSADGQADRLLFSDAFALMTPYTASVLTGFERIQANHPTWLKQQARPLETGFSRLWSHSNRVLHDRLSGQSLDTDTATYLIHTVCLVQTLIARQAGEFCAPHFAETWKILDRHDGLECPALRRLFINIGSYCGQAEGQVEYFRDPRATPLELSGLIALVRGVLSPGRPVLTRKFLTHPESLVTSLMHQPDPVLSRRVWEMIGRQLNNCRHHDQGTSRKVLAWLHSWLQLIRAGLPLHDSASARKVRHVCQQYRRTLCASADHTQVWSQVMSDFALLSVG